MKGKASRVEEAENYIQTDKGCDELLKLVRDGKTMDEIAKHFGVCRTTLYKWTLKYPRLNDRILESKQVADDRVEQSLYDSCFDHEVTEKFIEKDGDGNTTKITAKTRVIPANPTAIQYWLSNRRSKAWKARQQLEVSGADGSPLPVTIIDNLKETSDVGQPPTKDTGVPDKRVVKMSKDGQKQ